MAHITFAGNLRLYTDGQNELQLDVHNIGQLFAKLGEKFPELKPHLEEGVAVAIDGQIIQDSWVEPISEESEVHILPQIAGG